jgi:hypothetical protein
MGVWDVWVYGMYGCMGCMGVWVYGMYGCVGVKMTASARELIDGKHREPIDGERTRAH